MQATCSYNVLRQRLMLMHACQLNVNKEEQGCQPHLGVQNASQLFEGGSPCMLKLPRLLLRQRSHSMCRQYRRMYQQHCQPSVLCLLLCLLQHLCSVDRTEYVLPIRYRCYKWIACSGDKLFNGPYICQASFADSSCSLPLNILQQCVDTFLVETTDA